MSSKYWILVTTTPDLPVFVDKNRVDSYRFVKVENVLLLCHPLTYICNGNVNCSWFLKCYYYYNKVGSKYQAKVFTFKFCLKRVHKNFPLKQLFKSERRCYAVHIFPKQITKEEYYK